MKLLDELNSTERLALDAIRAATDLPALEGVRIEFLARSGRLSGLAERLREVPKEEKPEVGKRLNGVKAAVQTLFEARKSELEISEQCKDMDLTLPGRPVPRGSLHLITQILDRAIGIFQRMGFVLADGPDVETEFHNFDALNTPTEHPARNERDTFYIDRPPHPEQGRHLLRTHTSPVQIRVMRQQPPPLRILAPGRCYRRDEIDATHSTSFHQIEGLVVDETTTLADLKGCLEYFFQELLGPDTRVRLRPHFFPFTEPSFEVDLSNPAMRLKGKEWLEIAGCGMVDPNVFEACGIDPERFTGYAFGMGVDRLALLLHRVPDIRLLEQNDLRFLRQF